ncbi:hypothetical protein V8G54_030185 [Vigna mungo]|uniref:Uncharacterized protein n=1 Tax=Vigna mungo TaxID=3915 RepID=A0AAQ3MUQ8_VIGMU
MSPAHPFEFPRPVHPRRRNRHGHRLFQPLQCPHYQSPVGPRARQAHVQVEGARRKRAQDSEFGCGPRIPAGEVGGSKLGHHEPPRGVPGRAHRGDEDPRRKRLSPQQFCN